MSEKYFNALNYTIGNEDTSFEYNILPEKVRHILAAAGSGSRILPLIAKKPQYITCVDSSLEQLSLAELRVASLQLLDYNKFLGFWGYSEMSMLPAERKAIFENLTISDRAKNLLREIFKKNEWRSFLYVGKWERTFKKLSNAVRFIVGEKGIGIFNCQTKSDQDRYLQNIFPWNRWLLSVFLLGNSVVFNALLYKGSFPKKNIPQSMYRFYRERFNRLFKQDLARKNYFLQLLFFGKIKFSEGLPLECDPNIFSKAKKWISNVQIRYVHNDILEEAKQTMMPIDFLSISDIPSYLKPPLEQKYLQDIKSNISPNGIVVNRYYLHIPENLEIAGHKNVTENYNEAIAREKIQMYSFGIYQKI